MIAAFGHNSGQTMSLISVVPIASPKTNPNDYLTWPGIGSAFSNCYGRPPLRHPTKNLILFIIFKSRTEGP